MSEDEKKKPGEESKPGEAQGPIDFDSIQLDIADFTEGAHQRLHHKKGDGKPVAQPLRKRHVHHTPRSLPKVPAGIFWLFGVVAVFWVSIYLGKRNPELVQNDEVAKSDRAAVRVTAAEPANPQPSPRGPSPAPGPVKANPKAPGKVYGQLPPVQPLSAEEEAELPEEEKLARIDPMWRKQWETYKRLYILANQMKQQPPAKPRMPNATPEPQPEGERPPNEEDDNPNPFGFPQ